MMKFDPLPVRLLAGACSVFFPFSTLCEITARRDAMYIKHLILALHGLCATREPYF